MSRYDGKPTPGYTPLLRLNLRSDPEGGSLLKAVVPRWLSDLEIRQNELLVLVHGYNNHQGEAEGAYLSFRDGQRSKLSGAASQDAFERLLGDAFWPGDAEWSGVIDKLDFLFYPRAVAIAQKAAPLLKEYLTKRNDVLIVHFLAHSLGCRVVLEIIRWLRDSGAGPAIGKVCLAAAAVPTFKVCPGGELYGALNAPQSLMALYSPADTVLHWAFPPGQTLARGDEGFFPMAIGRHGDIPIHPGAVERRPIDGADHGDYWRDIAGTPSEQSAKEIADFFQFEGLAARTLPSRPLSSISSLSSRSISSARAVGDLG